MSRKTIEFPSKPLSKSSLTDIDAWVAGNIEQNTQEIKNKRTTIYMPEELHRKIKMESAKNETTMTEIILRALEAYTNK